MHWIAPSEKDTDNAAHISSLSASQGDTTVGFLPMENNNFSGSYSDES
jgi:hypothetical protein